MSVPSAAEQTLLNEPLHRSDLFLSIYDPDTVFSCQVTGSYDADTRSITYYNTSGDYTDITEFDFLIALIGTTAGGDEKGHTYVRNATSTQLQFSRSDQINWENGDYVTVLDFIEVTAIYPRIIQNPADELDVIFYKFYDVAYTNQNGEGLGQFVNMGCDYAGFLDPASGLLDVYFTSSGTSNLLGQGMTYSWLFEGGTPTGSTAHTPGNVSYDTPGHYKTTLEVSNGSGTATDRATRYVSIYDRPGDGNNNPITEWAFNEFSQNRENGVQRLGITIDQKVNKSTLIDGALVVIFADEWFGDTKQNIGGNALGRKSIKFVGYIEQGSIKTNYANTHAEFVALSSTGIMQLTDCYGISLESNSSPTTWYQMEDMDTRRAAYHYLRWHSTVLKRHDFQFVGNDRSLQYYENDRESLYATMSTLLHRRQAKLTADRQSKLWAEQEPSVLDSADTVFNTALSITSKDWLDEPNIDEQQTKQTTFIEMGGIYYDPVTNTFAAYLCAAPGVSSSYQGKVVRIQGLTLLNQAELNTFAGNLLAWENARYPSSDFSLRGNFANLDIAPQELIKVTMASDENNRGITWTTKAFAIRSINWNFDPVRKTMVPQVNLHEITQGFDADTITIPDVPPTDAGGDGGGSFDQQPIDVPPIPSGGIGILIYHNGVIKGYATALNFIDDSCSGAL